MIGEEEDCELTVMFVHCYIVLVNAVLLPMSILASFYVVERYPKLLSPNGFTRSTKRNNKNINTGDENCNDGSDEESHPTDTMKIESFHFHLNLHQASAKRQLLEDTAHEMEEKLVDSQIGLRGSTSTFHLSCIQKNSPSTRLHMLNSNIIKKYITFSKSMIDVQNDQDHHEKFCAQLRRQQLQQSQQLRQQNIHQLKQQPEQQQIVITASDINQQQQLYLQLAEIGNVSAEDTKKRSRTRRMLHYIRKHVFPCAHPQTQD